MKALTLYRPWPYAILALGKNVENRSWAPTNNQLRIGDTFLLHAGKRWDKEGAEYIQRLGYTVPPESEHPTGIVGSVIYNGLSRSNSNFWRMNTPYGWALTSPVSFESAVPCNGQMKLWNVPKDIMDKLQPWLGGVC